MTAITMKHFDVLDYVEKSRAFGANEDLARYQARQMEELLEIATNNARAAVEEKELANKKDLMEVQKSLELKIEQVRAEVHKSKFEMVLWVAGMFIASGLIQHFFK